MLYYCLQYTAGVRIVEDGSETFSIWQLLCCSGKSIKIRIDDCIDTKFLNDHHRSSTFFTGTQIIRKWQAVLDDKLISFSYLKYYHSVERRRDICTTR